MAFEDARNRWLLARRRGGLLARLDRWLLARLER